MERWIDLSVKKDRHAWAWSNALRAAMDFPDKESIKKLVSAALADGWRLSDALVEKGGGPECHEASLPELAAWRAGWRGEERSALVEALSELGVDWCQSGPRSDGSLIARAAGVGNWAALRSMVEAGASLLGGAEGREQPGLSPVAQFWGSVDARDWRPQKEQENEGPGQARRAAIGAAMLISKKQLGDAFASGAGDPKKWLPALAICAHQSAVLGAQSCEDGRQAMGELLAWGRERGCDDWSAPVEACQVIDSVALGRFKTPTLALWMAFHAVEAPAAWAVALGDASLGMQIDARSMWAVGQSVGRCCADASDWKELSESGLVALRALGELGPWASKIALSRQKPMARSNGVEGEEDRKELDSLAAAGWGAACASMCSGLGWGFNDKRASKPAGVSAHSKLGKALEVAARNAAGAMAWAGLVVEAPEWEEFANEFAGCFARNTTWTAWPQRGAQQLGTVELTGVAGGIINAARCAIAVLGHLSQAVGAGGAELADRCLARLALDFEQGLAEGPPERRWGCAIAEVANVLAEATWEQPKRTQGMEAWTSLCSKAIDALAQKDHGPSAGVVRSLALLESFILRGSCGFGPRTAGAALRV